MIKTYKYKLYVSKNNKKIDRQINIAGMLYNHVISIHKTYYRLHKKYPHVFTINKHITKLKKMRKHAYWNELNSQTIQNISERIDRAYKLFFRNNKKKIKSSPPSFRKIKKFKSITFKQNGYKINGNIIIFNKKIKCKFSKSRDFEGEIKTVTLKRDNLGDFYIYLACKIEDLEIVKTESVKMVGFDFGLKTFLTGSDGNNIESPLFLFTHLNKLRKLSKKHSKKVKGSKNRNKSRIRLAKLHTKISNKRRDWQFKTTKKIVESYTHIFLEDLSLKGMVKLWGRKISDLSLHTFNDILNYQSTKTGTVIHKVSRWFPSSKLCSSCGKLNDNLMLKDRNWKCDCGVVHNRDFLASTNILREGASSLGLDFVGLTS